MRRPAALAGAALACIAFAASTATPATRSAGGCGTGRVQVKTLTDAGARRVDLSPTETTVAALRRLPAPSRVGRARVAGVETTTYRVEARLVQMKLEQDGDVLLALLDPETHGTMVVEFPAAACTHAASAAARAQMRDARAALIAACGQPDRGSFTRIGGLATITGVGFFERAERTPDAAPNGVELHPVVGFHTQACLVGA